MTSFDTKNNQPLSDAENWFNTKKTRNCDNTDIEDYNCGGYCLNTFSWYNPYDRYYEEAGFDDFVSWVEDLYIGWELSLSEIYRELLEDGKERILADFPDTVRLIHNPEQLCEDEKLVVYKVGVIANEDEHYILHTDFHFMQWDGNCWSDKPGSTSIRENRNSIKAIINNPWMVDWWQNEGDNCEDIGYNSEPILFAVKRM